MFAEKITRMTTKTSIIEKIKDIILVVLFFIWLLHNNIKINSSKDKFIDNKEINYISQIYKEETIKNKENKFYLLICTSDLEIIEISNNFENYSFLQKIGEPNSIYDKALFISNKSNNKYILANSSWLSFLNLYKVNSINSIKLLTKINKLEENFVCFIDGIKGNNFLEILCANYIEDNDDTFYIIFYKIYDNGKIENKNIKVSSFINDSDCIVKINDNMAGLILGNYFNFDYEENNNKKENSKCINGISLIDLINKQIISTIEMPYYISKIIPISGAQNNVISLSSKSAKEVVISSKETISIILAR